MSAVAEEMIALVGSGGGIEDENEDGEVEVVVVVIKVGGVEVEEIWGNHGSQVQGCQSCLPQSPSRE